MKKSYLALFVSLLMTCAVRAEYLFVHFKMEKDAMGEQIYFGVSQDGLIWETLNNQKPVLVSDLGEKGVRDPHIIRSPDGKTFYLIATDLSIFSNRDWTRAVRQGSRAIIIWESKDLVNWSAPRRVEVAPKDAGCTWAPECLWDEKKGEYLAYWASTIGREDFKKQAIWAAYTKDFKTFSEPFVYITRGNHVIDTTIVQDGKTYYRFSKDERGKAITMEKSDALTGKWDEMENFSLKSMKGYEGPTCYRTAEGEWCLLLDFYSKGQGYKPFFAKDIASGQFTSVEGKFKTPYKYRHGTVMSITPEEYGRLTKCQFKVPDTGMKP